MPRFAVAFSLSSVGQYLGFAGSNPFVGSMDLFRKKLFLGFRGFESLRRRDGSVLEGTICKQFVSNAKNRKNLKPCRGFKSFRSLAFRIQFLKNRIFGSSNPSTRRKIENGSMEIRKKLGAKKAEKSLEISAFLFFSVGSKTIRINSVGQKDSILGAATQKPRIDADFCYAPRSGAVLTGTPKTRVHSFRGTPIPAI